MRGLLRSLRDLSLRGKVALTLAVVFLFSLAALLLVLVPVLAGQRQRLLEQDKRLLSTLRRNHEREFIYDQLQGNRDSLALHLDDLAGQEGILWARLEAGGLDLGATADGRSSPACWARTRRPSSAGPASSSSWTATARRTSWARAAGPSSPAAA